MARAKCPCCGKPYNGQKCRECLYEAFEETEKHDHAHGTRVKTIIREKTNV